MNFRILIFFAQIYTVRDEYSLQNYNRTYMNFEWRANNTDPLTNQTYMDGDMLMNTLFMGYPLKYKGLAFIPSLFAFVCFVIFIYYFGRWKPKKDDPYAGRMKKVRKYPRLRSLRDSLVASFRRQSSTGKASPRSVMKPSSREEDVEDSYGNEYKKIEAHRSDRSLDRNAPKVSYPENWNP